MSKSGKLKAKRNSTPAFADLDDLEEFEEWPPEQVGNVCVGCDLPAVVNDLGLCWRCNTKLDRDMIRDRDWERSETAFLTPEDKREELRQQVIRKYGAAFELIGLPDKIRKSKRSGPPP